MCIRDRANDVAGVGFVHDGAVLRHQLGAGGQLDVLALLHKMCIRDRAKGVRTALQEEGAVGILTGGLTAAAAGVTPPARTAAPR